MRRPGAVSARGYPPYVVPLLCTFCFFLGRYIPNISHTPEREIDKGFITYGKNEPEETIREHSNPPSADFSSAAEFVLKAAPPPVTAGESGSDHYTVAPFQVLPSTVMTGFTHGSNFEFEQCMYALIRASENGGGSCHMELGFAGCNCSTSGMSAAWVLSMDLMKVLSWYPRVVLFPKFIDKEKSDHIIKLAEIQLGPSTVSTRIGDSESKHQNVRTSQGTFMSSKNDGAGVLKWLEDKIAEVTMIPASHGEAFNILRYNIGQKYESHYDVFDPASYGPQNSMRIATVLVYLSDVEKGGETVLPLEGKNGADRLKQPGWSYKDCSKGLRYKPRMGDALLFYSISPNGTFDSRSLHGGCPVVSGEKWVATKWIRDLPRVFRES